MLGAMTLRNIKLYFKDKGMFFTSLITPMILLVLYVTFLGRTYSNSYESSMPKGFSVTDGVIDAAVGAQLMASLLSVCCVTVSFCCNMIMVQDKVNGTASDLLVSPAKNFVLSASYYIASLVSSLIVCFAAFGVCLLYINSVGWFMSGTDVLLLSGDIVLTVMFGTALSSMINVFLTTQGQISAVGTVVSAGYGFICGAYMPISQFGDGLQKVLSFLPSTYSASLFKVHALRGVLEQMSEDGVPNEVITGIKDAMDCSISFGGEAVSQTSMFIIVGSAALAAMLIYAVLNAAAERKCR
ncbi:MAG: ABC transporter permease [Oscillospiraceae bacterium]